MEKRLDEIPVGDTDYYWRSGSASDENAPILQLNKVYKFGESIEIKKNHNTMYQERCRFLSNIFSPNNLSSIIIDFLLITHRI
jgi:hypothetical protein